MDSSPWSDRPLAPWSGLAMAVAGVTLPNPAPPPTALRPGRLRNMSESDTPPVSPRVPRSCPPPRLLSNLARSGSPGPPPVPGMARPAAPLWPWPVAVGAGKPPVAPAAMSPWPWNGTRTLVPRMFWDSTSSRFRSSSAIEVPGVGHEPERQHHDDHRAPHHHPERIGQVGIVLHDGSPLGTE